MPTVYTAILKFVNFFLAINQHMQSDAVRTLICTSFVNGKKLKRVVPHFSFDICMRCYFCLADVDEKADIALPFFKTYAIWDSFRHMVIQNSFIFNLFC